MNALSVEETTRGAVVVANLPDVTWPLLSGRDVRSPSVASGDSHALSCNGKLLAVHCIHRQTDANVCSREGTHRSSCRCQASCTGWYIYRSSLREPCLHSASSSNGRPPSTHQYWLFVLLQPMTSWLASAVGNPVALPVSLPRLSCVTKPLISGRPSQNVVSNVEGVLPLVNHNA